LSGALAADDAPVILDAYSDPVSTIYALARRGELPAGDLGGYEPVSRQG
jgi:hypothetical protein